MATNYWPSASISPLILGAHPLARQQTVHDILDPLSSAECNSHLAMFILDSVLMTLIPEMGNTADPGMIDGPPPIARTQSRLAGPAREASDTGENGNSRSEEGRNPSPSQSSAVTGVYVHA